MLKFITSPFTRKAVQIVVQPDRMVQISRGIFVAGQAIGTIGAGAFIAGTIAGGAALIDVVAKNAAAGRERAGKLNDALCSAVAENGEAALFAVRDAILDNLPRKAKRTADELAATAMS